MMAIAAVIVLMIAWTSSIILGLGLAFAANKSVGGWPSFGLVLATVGIAGIICMFAPADWAWSCHRLFVPDARAGPPEA